jgi:hypothetical protein
MQLNMKQFSILTLLAMTMALSGCSDEHYINSAREYEIDLLTSAPWVTQTVKHTIVGDLTSEYRNFSIAFTRNKVSGYDGQYTVVDGQYAFPELSGNWKFSQDLTQLHLANGLELSITLSTHLMSLEFEVSSDGESTDELYGQFIFNLKR